MCLIEMRVAFTDMYPNYEKELNTKLPFSYFTSRGWKVVSPEEKPDLIFSSVFRKNRSCYPKIKKILWSGENLNLGVNWRDNLYLHDVNHAMITNHPEDIAFPITSSFYVPYGGIHYNYEKLRKERVLREKKKFCCFVSSNSYDVTGYVLRDHFFHYLYENYKSVDSAGGYLNNTGYNAPRQETEYFKWISEYKFMICFENGLGAGYMTEKIFSPYASATIPIYWGDETNLKYINPKACIIYTTPEETLARIKELDEDDEKYQEVIGEELLTPLGREIFSQKRVEDYLDLVLS